jgi:hypothetical protein
MRLTVVPQPEVTADPAVRPSQDEAAAMSQPTNDKLRTARGFVIGIMVSLAIWVVLGIVCFWLVL